jgi:1,2-diacylglycerol 3-beta-glucosyltransferase
VIIAVALFVAFALYVTAYVVYQTALFAGNAAMPDPPSPTASKMRRFVVIIPAHDEELHLPRLLASFRAQTYAKDRYRVAVVADNCTDGTVAACRPFDVDVLERIDARRGKGHAIRWALERVGPGGFDAVVIVDSDSLVDARLLEELNLAMERGDRVIQCYNGVANPCQSWFTGLMDVSRTIANDIVHPGKRKLGLSSHLMGNGMCFDVGVLTSYGWDAFSVGEDWEYYARLIMNGVPIGYSRTARVYHQESVDLRQASSQRLRWASGRFHVLRQYGPRLIWHGLRTRNLTCVDAALPLAFPNPSLGLNLTLLGVALAAAGWLMGGGITMLVWFSGLVLAQVAMFVIGILHTEHKLRNAATVVVAPLFLVWKMGIDIISLFGVGTKEWKRTERRTF